MIPTSSTSSEWSSSYPGPDPELTRKNEHTVERNLVRKLDLRMAILVIMFMLTYIDRGNIAPARLQGLEEDLGLVGAQYPTVLSIFSVGFILVMVPSNMFLNYVKRSSIYLPACSIACGVVTLLTGFTKNFTTILICHLFLGLVTGCFLPGAFFILSIWYKKEEIGFRSAILFCGMLAGPSVGTLMAAGILEGMDGKLGQAGWRWLFWIEGALTVAFTIPALVILPDFPDHPSTSKWLTPDELALALRRKRENSAEPQTNSSKFSGLNLAIRDWKAWWLCLTAISLEISLSFVYFLPTVTQAIGYSDFISLVLCTPPVVSCGVYSLILSWHSDRTNRRFPHIFVSMVLCVCGYIIAISTTNKGARYFSIFLMQCVTGAHVVLLAWVNDTFNNEASKLAVVLGLVSASSQLGSIGASYVFPKKWGPHYSQSFAISMAAGILFIGMCAVHQSHMKSLNKKTKEAQQRLDSEGKSNI